MGVRPLGDRILVKKKKKKEEKQGTIIIPDTAKEKPQEAKVVAVGPGKRKDDGERIAVDVKKGDVVLISKYGGTDVKLGGEEHIIIREDDILAVVE